MDVSIYLAKLLGLYLMILGLAWLLRRDAMQRLAKDYADHPSAIGLAGILALAMGLAIVIGHNVWTGWPIIITLLGYLILVKGIFRLFSPEHEKKALALVRGSSAYVIGFAVLVLGGVLTYFGFFW